MVKTPYRGTWNVDYNPVDYNPVDYNPWNVDYNPMGYNVERGTWRWTTNVELFLGYNPVERGYEAAGTFTLLYMYAPAYVLSALSAAR